MCSLLTDTAWHRYRGHTKRLTARGPWGPKHHSLTADQASLALATATSISIATVVPLNAKAIKRAGLPGSGHDLYVIYLQLSQERDILENCLWLYTKQNTVYIFIQSSHEPGAVVSLKTRREGVSCSPFPFQTQYVSFLKWHVWLTSKSTCHRKVACEHHWISLLLLPKALGDSLPTGFFSPGDL